MCNSYVYKVLRSPPCEVTLLCVLLHTQAMCLAVGRGVLYSAGTDLCLRSWHLDTLEEVGLVQVQTHKHTLQRKLSGDTEGRVTCD